MRLPPRLRRLTKSTPRPSQPLTRSLVGTAAPSLRHGLNPLPWVDDPPDFQVHPDLSLGLSFRRCVRTRDLDHASASSVRGKACTAEVTAEVVHEGRVVKENEHGRRARTYFGRTERIPDPPGEAVVVTSRNPR